jgi:hypothetical protein
MSGCTQHGQELAGTMKGAIYPLAGLSTTKCPKPVANGKWRSCSNVIRYLHFDLLRNGFDEGEGSVPVTLSTETLAAASFFSRSNLS